MVNRLLSISFLVFVGVSSFIFFFVALMIWLLTVWFDKKLVVLHLFSSLWASLYLWIVPIWSVSVIGREKIKKGSTYVAVSNHQSALDILVVYKLFFPFKWVSKAENFKIPFIGWNMVLNRYIKLTRGNKESIKKMMEEAENALTEGCSLFMFPEGTRSATGKMRPFKTGAFTLAKKAGVSILPVVINGTKDALPKNRLIFNGRHKISINVLDEIPYDMLKTFTEEQAAEMTQKKISENLY